MQIEVSVSAATRRLLQAGTNVEFTMTFPPGTDVAALDNSIREFAADPGSKLSSSFKNAYGVPTVSITTPLTGLPSADDGLSDGAIAGIVIGSVAGVIIIAVVVFLIIRKRGSSAAQTVAPRDVERAQPK